MANEPIWSRSRTFFETFTRAKRICDPNGHADQALELGAEPGQVRGAAGEDDLADAQRAGLVLVELERGDELPRKRL